MSVLKCKMCGGDLEVLEGMSVCECMYCGSRQTLPKMGNEKKNNLYDRANHFRRNNEYDKAMAIYEQILNEEAEDSETYWSILLCRYGIEYVEDPATHRRVPTVNRAQMTSVFLDEDYKAAIRYADAEQKTVYEAEAKEIDRIQKGILEISSKEEPFDIFICYKESDADGRRTEDSVLANDLYHQLTQEGFRVFFARITLEDKLGVAYEPYIFAALNSAKVMVVLGTKPEHFNAVWVKNEWSRYLALIKGGAKKILIPAYKNMDPYDLPEEFSHLQAQDMGKLGFMQDLIRGIRKLAGEEKKTQETVQVSGNSNAQPLIERAFLFLEDGDFARADELCEQALNQEPQNARAYVGKLMAERKIRKQEELSSSMEILAASNYFQKAVRFAEDALREELERCNEMIIDRKNGGIYQEACRLMADSEKEGFNLPDKINMLQKAIQHYESILGFRDDIDADIELAQKKKSQFEEMLEEQEKRAKKKRDKEAKIVLAIAGLLGIAIIGWTTFTQVISPRIEYHKTYQEAEKYIEEGNYEEALSVMKTVAVEETDELWIYGRALTYKNAGAYLKAKELFDSLQDYKDSKEQSNKCYEMWQEGQQEDIYQQAVAYIDTEEYMKAKELFDSLQGYKDSGDQSNECAYRQAVIYKKAERYLDAKKLFDSLYGYKDSEDQSDECTDICYQQAIMYMEAERYPNAKKLFESLGSYKDSVDQCNECAYQLAIIYMEAEKYLEAKELFDGLESYKDSADLNIECTYYAGCRYYILGQYAEAKELFDSLGLYRESESYSKKCSERMQKD